VPGDRRLGPVGCSSSSAVIWLLIAIAVGAWLWSVFDIGGTSASRVSYSEFREQVRLGNVASVQVSGDEVRGVLREPAEMDVGDGRTIEYVEFVTFVPSFGDEQLLTLLTEHDVRIVTEPEGGSALLPILLNVLPLVLFGAVIFFLFRRTQSQGQSLFSMGESRARLYSSDVHTTFDDVAGSEQAKAELREVIQFLKEPEKFRKVGAEVPKGVLLVGPPGTGKTLLARAVAGEAQVPFFSITGSDFMEMFVGVGASRVRKLFDQAKRNAPSIVFIDELDSIGRRRGAGLGGGHDEREQTLNQLLSEMDGFEPNRGIILMAATNRPDILDPALLRPGRFDRRIAVELPTVRERLAILKIHARNKPLADDVDLDLVARGTPGFSGADLENLLNEAALLAARDGRDVVHAADVDNAKDKALLGLERGDLALTDKEMRLLAYHEGGHAVVAAALPNADPIHKVTIVPRGRAMGVTQQLPERDRYVYPWEYMLDRLAVMMGGRAAEEVALGTATSGAENDLKEATRLARKMVLDWGVTDRVGHVALGGDGEYVFLGEEIARGRDYSEATAREVDLEVRRILDQAHERAVETLREHRDALDRIAESLLDKEEMSGDEVLNLLGITREEAEAQTSVID